ncbi:MAG TPA: 6-pyruvoyl-tetrahydropterin synthase-related protein [Candidatus Binatia bacterium]|nr:6-pyruvoyl-tetrahydropterin synthase-related protein [Candidatus Binatia bacterium]
MRGRLWLGWLEALLVFSSAAFLLYIYPWEHLLAKTITAGGDTASHFYPALLMRDQLLPAFQWTGWTMGNYAGFPIFHFYSTLPFVAIALLGYAFPLEQSFKLVSLLGPTTLPLAAGYLFWAFGYRRGGPILAAASVLPFLFQQGNSMWGGNIPSVLAGEFCHAIGLSLSLVFLGHLHRLSKGMGSWIVNGLLLAAIALSHAFAFIGALWFALFYLRPRTDSVRIMARVAPAFVLAAMLVAFWGFPLLPRVKFTTEWTMIWRINDWKEVVPELLWPAAILTVINLALMAIRLKKFSVERHGLMIFALFGSAVLYAVSPVTGFPDIRFVPIGQMFLGFLAADLLVWLATPMRFPLVLSTAGALLCMGWAYQHIGYLSSWLDWNYSGYERKSSWGLFKAINDHVRGDIQSPRMVFEHAQTHNKFGSSRAFENLPLFAQRATLEGVFHQVSPNSPFVFYIQSEVSEKTSGPFHQYSYMRLNPEAALPHLRMYNVGTIVVASEKARAAYDANPAYERTFSQGGYAIYDIPSGVTGYVVAAASQPVLYDGPDYLTAFYRWFKHPELLDIPLVPKDIIGDEAAETFELRTDTVRDIPRRAYDGPCEVRTVMEQQRVSFDTSCPGRPHIVKVSYFPRWKSVDGSPIHLVSPGFMLVYPSSGHFEMYYGRTLLDYVAMGTTALGVLWLLAASVSPRVSRASVTAAGRIFRPIYAPVSRYPRSIFVAFVVICIAAGALVRYEVRDDDVLYREGQTAYRERKFERAIEVFREYAADDRDTFKNATSLSQMGISYSELQKFELAVDTLERLRFNFPNIDFHASTLFHLARSYAGLGNLALAIERAKELRQKYADTPYPQRLDRENKEVFQAAAPPPAAAEPVAAQPSAAAPPDPAAVIKTE